MISMHPSGSAGSSVLTRRAGSPRYLSAALSTLKVPHPLDVFQGSALGFHMHLKKKRMMGRQPAC